MRRNRAGVRAVLRWGWFLVTLQWVATLMFEAPQVITWLLRVWEFGG